jgi:hypothetical protein
MINMNSLISLIKTLGPRVVEVWPDIQEMGKRLQHIITVMSGGQIVFEGGPGSAPITDEGSTAVHMLTKQGIDRNDAITLVKQVESAEGHLNT